jgi:hypothetical protein
MIYVLLIRLKTTRSIRLHLDNISVTNKQYDMNNKEIYNELRMIDEFHANFNPTRESKSRMRLLISLLPVSPLSATER